jgi:hypothetical protein
MLLVRIHGILTGFQCDELPETAGFIVISHEVSRQVTPLLQCGFLVEGCF